MYRINTFKIQLIRDSSIKVENLPKIESSQDAVNIIRQIPEIKYADREHFVVLFLNTKHRVLWIDIPFHGTIDASSVFPREILKAAILCGAAAIVVAHNHPSGEPAPSREDIQITKELNSACELMQVRLLDHIIVGDGNEKFVSMRDSGLM